MRLGLDEDSLICLVVEFFVILFSFSFFIFVVGEFFVAVGRCHDGAGFGYVQTFGGGLDGTDYFAGARVGEAGGIAAG